VTPEFLQARIAATEAQIVAYESAVDALATGVQSYTLDTGQTRQTVTRSDVSSLQRTLDTLYNRLATLNARAGNGGTTYVRPCW